MRQKEHMAGEWKRGTREIRREKTQSEWDNEKRGIVVKGGVKMRCWKTTISKGLHKSATLPLKLVLKSSAVSEGRGSGRGKRMVKKWKKVEKSLRGGRG